MQKLIEVQWEGVGGTPHVGDAIVEYIEYVDNDEGQGIHEREVINIFLPEYIPAHWHTRCKQQAEKLFNHT